MKPTSSGNKESKSDKKVSSRATQKPRIKKEEDSFGDRKFAASKDERKPKSVKPKRIVEEDDVVEYEAEERFFKKERKSFDKEKKHTDKDKKTIGVEKKSFDKDRKSFDKDRKSFDKDRKPFDKDRKPFDKDRKPFDKDRKPFDKDRKPFDKDRKPFDKDRKPFDKDRKPFDKDRKPFDKDRKPFDKERKPFDKDRKPFDREKNQGNFGENQRKLFDKERKSYKPKEAVDRSNDRVVKELAEEKKFDKKYKGYEEKPSWERKDESTSIDGEILLNKYIAHSGECSRRDAAEMVKQGKVRVNGELVLQPAYKVQPGDSVTLGGKKLTPTKGFVYILLNKPKDYITTTEDPNERKTVMELVQNSGVNRLFPVGRLDRKTTGLLLLTNDGNLAHKLSHPSFNIKKVYQVTLDKNLTTADYQKITKGVELEDGLATVDSIAYLEHRNEIGLEIHSGKNRIVRRIFESLGYTVDKLDRVMYAGLTKKNLPRGKWRFLEEKEVIFLKHFK